MKDPDDGRTRKIEKVLSLIHAENHQDALLLLTCSARAIAGKQSSLNKYLAHIPVFRRLRKTVDKKYSDGQRKRFITAILDKDGCQADTTNLIRLYFNEDQKNAFDYFKFRFGQPRALVSLSLASTIPFSYKPVLDLGCGFGHIACGVSDLVGRAVIGVDSSFYPLFIAKRYIAPSAEFVCCDANVNLPFSDDTFSATISTNTIHFIRNKLTCIREVKRITEKTGPILLASIRHALMPHKGHAFTPAPAGYQELFSDIPYCMKTDRAILQSYLNNTGPQLKKSDGLAILEQSPLISVVACHEKEIFKDHGAFSEWPHAVGNLGINPLYDVAQASGDGPIRLVRHYPSDFYHEENAESDLYLPEYIEAGPSVFQDLERRNITPDIKKLIEQFVVLGIPKRYVQLNQQQ
jgi:ubiquinone/menaquinone biosynthesis C-methylase UbiE